jgi:diguanylate cyclase (GGDEF)-like protein
MPWRRVQASLKPRGEPVGVSEATQRLDTYERADLSAFAVVGIVLAVVFGASMFGILTRPLGFLAAIWPANGIVLGLFVARMDLARPIGWVAAVAGFLLAGAVSGDALPTNLWLTAANVSGVLAGYLAYRNLGPEDRALERPLSVLYMLLICLLSATVAALVGCGLAPILFDRPILSGFVYWFSTELTNFIITVPVMLTAPAFSQWGRIVRELPAAARDPALSFPVIGCALSVAGAIVIGGAGAIAFPVPALLWCSLTFGLFPTTIIIMMVSMAMMVAETLGYMQVASANEIFGGTSSFRIGITLLMVGPLTVTSIALAQKKLLLMLDEAVNTDGLTNVLARRALLERSADWIENWDGRQQKGGMAVMMIDIDHFKQVNDSHGHAAGDAVLVAASRAIAKALRAGDLFGRLGGEESAICLRDIAREDAMALAERLCRLVEELEIRHEAGALSKVTVSIGLAHEKARPDGGIGVLLQAADQALYNAKRMGRNRVSLYGEEPTLALSL